MEVSPHSELASLRRQLAELQQSAKMMGDGSSRQNSFSYLDELAEAVVCVDAAWQITYINARAAAAAGLSVSELPGRSVWDVFPQWRMNHLQRGLRQVMEERLNSHFEFLHAPSTWLEVDAAPYGDGLVLFARDISARRKAEEAIRVSEERYRSLAAVTSAVVWTTGPDGNFVERQLSWEAFTGQSPDEYRDFNGFQPIHPEDRDRVIEAWQRAITSRTQFEIEYRLWHAPSSTYADVCSRGAPVLEANGAPREWVGTIQDVTARKRTEQALREREAEYRALLASTPDVVSRFNRELQFLYTSPQVQRYTGMPPEHFIGKTHSEAGLPADLCGKLDAALLRTFDTGKRQTVEFTLASPDGELHSFWGLGIPEFDSSGQVNTVLTIIRDVTELKRVEREQKAVERELMLLIEASGALLASPRSSEVLQTIVRLAQRFISADAHAVWRRKTGRLWELTVSSGLSEEFIASARIEEHQLKPLAAPLFVRDIRSTQLLERRLAMLEREGICSLMIIPINIHGEFAGTVVFYWRHVHQVDEAAMRIASALANLAASALSTAELYEKQLELTEHAEQSRRRTAFVAQAGALLSSSLQFESTLQSLARLAVPEIADWCSVDIVDDSGEIKRVALEHANVEKVRLAYEFSSRYPADENDLARVALRTGQPALVQTVPDDMLVEHARDPEHLRILRNFAIRSFMIIPMVIHGRSFGTISFVYADSGRSYTEADFQIAKEIGHRAATAIEHARLYRDVQVREQRYRSLVAATTSIVWTVDPSGSFVEPQESWERYTGQSWSEHKGRGWIEAIHPDDREQVELAWKRSSGVQAMYLAEGRVWHQSSQTYRYFAARAVPVRNPDETVREWIGTFTDVHETKQAEQERDRLLLREKQARQTAELLNRVGPILGSELDHQRLVQKITDLATELTGAGFGAFFHNLVDERGESYLLYTLSGARHEDFARFPMPRATELFAPTFRGEKPVRAADVLDDPRFGKNSPYCGMPEGHLPVRSYLAVPVMSRSGEVLGGLFFGHPEPGRFTEQHEELAAGIAAQAGIAVDNSRLFSSAHQARQELERSNAELRRANADLEQFAYSASHDLREPLRMVSVYSQLLQRKYEDKLDARATEYLNFAVSGAQRMEMLIRDLLAYTEAVGGSTEQAVACDAGHALAEAVTNLTGAIEESAAHVRATELPTVAVSQVHLIQLFQNLIGNAIKYRSETPPRIQVSAEREGSMWRFCVEDDGIGIAPEFRQQIFGIFKRLHAGKHDGTGVGLAICQKITDRYGGRIWVEPAKAGRGSRFCFTLPSAEPERV
jgi:PAS domain S-box-containing protein